MIISYIVVGGVILVSLTISLIIAYLYVKLIFLISERYASHFRNKPRYSSRSKGQYTSETINFVIFLKSIYHFTHLHNIWSGLRYPFRKHYANSEIKRVYCNEECKGYDECNQGNPKPRFHNGNVAQEDKGNQPNANKTTKNLC